MRPLSDALAAQLRQSHRVAVTLPVTRDGQAQVDLARYIIGGQVTVQRAGIQRRVDVTLANWDASLTITDALDLLSPLASNDLEPARGAVLPDGSVETVPLGRFRIASAEPESDGTISVNGYDYGWVVSRNRFESAYQIPAGTNVATAVDALLKDRLPGVETNFAATSVTTPLLTLDEQSDPWEQAVELAESLGRILEFTPEGQARMRQEPTTVGDAAAVWSFAAGDAQGTLLSAQRTFNAEDVHNVVIVTGETTGGDTPVRGTAEDLNVNSPTYTGGPYGRVPTFHRLSTVTSEQQAREAAVAILSREIGYSSGVRITAIPNPALELADVVRVQEDDTSLDGRFFVNGLAIPLRADQMMTVETRAEIGVDV